MKWRLGKSLWRGLIILIPVVVIFYLVDLVVMPLDDIGRAFLRLFIPSGFVVLGTGLIVVAVFVLVAGRLVLFFEERNYVFWNRYVRRIPLIGPFVVSGGGALSLEQLEKMTPCKFWLSDTTPHYGFIVREQKVRGAENEIDVYRPNVPSIIPGDLMPLKKRLVIKLGNPAGEVLQKLASGGFFSPEEEIPLPWEGETESEFRERINLTPLEIAVKKILQVAEENRHSAA